MENFIKIAESIAREAGKLLKDGLKENFSFKFKSKKDIVTIFDEKAEELIVKNIKKNFPDHNILAEEKKYPSASSPYKWLIDPLDGTVNYAHKFPHFAVSVALEKNAEVILGVVYNPMLDELFTAQKGKGAYLNGKKIKISSIQKISRSLLVTGFPAEMDKIFKRGIKILGQFLFLAQALRRPGSASLDLCDVAAGRFDGYWELKLNPWDTAAGFLIVKEAGGKVTDFTGEEFSIYDQSILATNGWIHEEMLKILKGY